LFEFRVEEVFTFSIQHVLNKITSCENVKLSQNIVNHYLNFGLKKYLHVVSDTFQIELLIGKKC